MGAAESACLHGRATLRPSPERRLGGDPAEHERRGEPARVAARRDAARVGAGGEHAGRHLRAAVDPQAAERGGDARRRPRPRRGTPRRSTGAPAAPRRLDHVGHRALAHAALEGLLSDLVPRARARLARRPLHHVDLRPGARRDTCRRRGCGRSHASRTAAPGARSPPSPRAPAAPACCARRTRPSRAVGARRPARPRRSPSPGAPRRGAQHQLAGARSDVAARRGRVSAWKPPVASTTGTSVGKLAQRLAERDVAARRAQQRRRSARACRSGRRSCAGCRSPARAPVRRATRATRGPRRGGRTPCAGAARRRAGHSRPERPKSRCRQITPLESSIDPPRRSPFSSSATRAPQRAGLRGRGQAGHPGAGDDQVRGPRRSLQPSRRARSPACARRTRA